MANRKETHARFYRQARANGYSHDDANRLAAAATEEERGRNWTNHSQFEEIEILPSASSVVRGIKSLFSWG